MDTNTENSNKTLWVCKACNKEFHPKSIKRHLRAEKCRKQFSQDELKEIDDRSAAAKKRQQAIYKVECNRNKDLDDDNCLWACKACNKKFQPKSILRHLRVLNCREKFTPDELSELEIKNADARKVQKAING